MYVRGHTRKPIIILGQKICIWKKSQKENDHAAVEVGESVEGKKDESHTRRVPTVKQPTRRRRAAEKIAMKKLKA